MAGHASISGERHRDGRQTGNHTPHVPHYMGRMKNKKHLDTGEGGVVGKPYAL
jgi:hypothetical protein